MMVIIAIKDIATETFGNPIVVRHQGEAIRSFMDECKNKESNLAKHPADFELWKIGYYNEQTGQIAKDLNPDELGFERIARAIDYTETK